MKSKRIIASIVIATLLLTTLFVFATFGHLQVIFVEGDGEEQILVHCEEEWDLNIKHYSDDSVRIYCTNPDEQNNVYLPAILTAKGTQDE